ncbi:MAG: hypothetical protein ACQEUT_20130 [Bacillota bacterium]
MLIFHVRNGRLGMLGMKGVQSLEGLWASSFGVSAFDFCHLQYISLEHLPVLTEPEDEVISPATCEGVRYSPACNYRTRYA